MRNNLQFWTLIFSLVFIGFLFGCEDEPRKNGSADSDFDSDTDGDSDSDSDSDSDDTDTDTGTGKPVVDLPDDDNDSDGYTNNEGDCNDLAAMISPDAFEDLGADGKGDGIDNDCDSEVDEIEDCDTEQVYTNDNLDKSANSLAAAINLCDKRFLKNATKTHSNVINYDVAYETLHRIGTIPGVDCFKARQGKSMAVIATGPIMQSDANQAEPIDQDTDSDSVNDIPTADDPQPMYQGTTKVWTSSKQVCDLTQFSVELKAPPNAKGFSFDFLFASAEYDQWLDKGWNDSFYAIMEYESLNGGATTNIAFDSNGNEIEVDSNFFENKQFTCDERGTAWSPTLIDKAGSTGWLRTTWNLKQGSDEFKLTFSIHDEGETGVVCGWDSVALIDNFRWIGAEIEIIPGTEPVIVE